MCALGVEIEPLKLTDFISNPSSSTCSLTMIGENLNSYFIVSEIVCKESVGKSKYKSKC